MLLEGSCHCKSVQFKVESTHPYPYNVCYCGVCRKTAGGGGSVVNLGADNKTLEIEGKEHIRIYQAKIKDETTGEIKESEARRHFCGNCGSPLWVWDPRWPELVHPIASSIDTELPTPPERTHLMMEFKASWVEPQIGPKDQQFELYPKESIAGWHQRLDLEK